MIKKYTKGFTLIELLVVIAIIGILSSIVLASLNTARSKGSDAAVKSNLSNIRAQAEIVYDNASPNSYAAVCADQTVINGLSGATTAGGNGGACSNASGTWAVWAGLKFTPADAWCVDNTGASKEITKPTDVITSC